MEVLWPIVAAWITDSRIVVILALIGLDLILGVADALKHRAFQWRALGDFYATNVVPKLMGYIGLHVVIGAVAGVDTLVGDGAQWIAFSVLAASLVASIAENFRDIYGQGLPTAGDNVTER